MRRYTGLHAQRIMADRATIKFFRLSQTIAFIDFFKPVKPYSFILVNALWLQNLL